ncbi:hypothetical protein L3Y34_003583 [Caenorhabditis briggsae]|uniref:PAN-3 domain-containing protein n=2 Tax=Caenorhabditis briggsae TaxID=6238 RepID=A0AAE9A9M1_CAEBR|nr:hypothetical protein L3Y34_003583 [Caenorhabditis briggsae]
MKLAHFLCCSIMLIESVNAALIMAEVYGKPTTTKEVYSSKVKSWNECIAECYHVQSCVAAWKNGSTCYTFDYWLMETITQTKQINGSIVAFKIENKSKECPSGSNPPTFGNKNATGSLYIDYDSKIPPMWVHFNIYYTEGTWKLNYEEDRFCGEYQYDGFVSHADSTVSCSFVWYNEYTTGYTYDEVKETCDKYAYDMAGFKYKEDVAMFVESAKKYLGKIKDTKAYVRVDGIRTAACQKTPKTAYCMSEKGFTFTGPTPDFSLYKWVTNSSAQHVKGEDCIVMIIDGNAAVKMDVRACTDTVMHARIFICSLLRKK